MKRLAPKIAAFAIASVALGSLLALTIPTELRTAPNSRLDQLSEPQITEFPGAAQVVSGQDSYAVTYSPQFRAVAERAERARAKQAGLLPVETNGYDQPGDNSEAHGAGEVTPAVTVRRGSTDTADRTPPEIPDLADADAPEG